MPLAPPDLTFEQVADSPDDFIQEQNHEDEKVIFRRFIWQNKDLIKLFVFLHLNLKSGAGFTIFIPSQDQWEEGRFNLSFPIEVRQFNDEVNLSIWFRVPMPSALGEDENAGNVEEKVRIEAASHIWMHDNCPNVPIPHLYGFGFADERHFTHVQQHNERAQLARFFQCVLTERHAEKTLSQYVRNGKFRAPFAYLIYEYIPGTKLTEKMLDDINMDHYTNLYASVSSILISMASVPQEKIGSFCFQDDGTISLSGRPQFAAFTQYEAAGVEPTIGQGDTYNNTEVFFSDLVEFQRNRFLDYRNAVVNEEDAKEQLGSIAILRSIANRFIKRGLRKGPFIMQLTELDMSHLIVDEEWKVVSLLDLDFMSSLPVEMFQEPHWMTGRLVDMNPEEFYTQDEMRFCFIGVFRPIEEFMKPLLAYNIFLHHILQEQFLKGAAWFWESIISLNGVSDFVRKNSEHMTFPAGGPDLFDVFYKLWGPDADEVIARKVADRASYLDKLQMWFRARDLYRAHAIHRADGGQQITTRAVTDVTDGISANQQAVASSSSGPMEACEEDIYSDDTKR